MMVKSDREFSHPHFGSECRIEQFGREVRLTFIANTEAKATDLTDSLMRQLKRGALNLTMMGKPTKVTEL